MGDGNAGARALGRSVWLSRYGSTIVCASEKLEVELWRVGMGEGVGKVEAVSRQEVAVAGSEVEAGRHCVERYNGSWLRGGVLAW